MCNGNLGEACPLTETKTYKEPFNNVKIYLNSALNCSSSNLVTTVDKSILNSPKLKERFREHKSSVRANAKNVIGEHFKWPGHSVAHMQILAIEKVNTPEQKIIVNRESFWINRLEAESRGLNRNKSTNQT